MNERTIFQEAHYVPCRGCKQLIGWGKKFGKAHPFNPDGSSHFDTCPAADRFRTNPKPVEEPRDKVNDFAIDVWLRRRLGLAQKRGTSYRAGTYTATEAELKRDLLYDYSRATGLPEQKAKSRLKKVWATQTVLRRDDAGYFLKGEPRVDLVNGLPVYRDAELQRVQEERWRRASVPYILNETLES